MANLLRKERFHIFNSLVGVVKGLEGQYTTIDLQNEGCLTGKIINVDGFMNVELEDVILYDPRGAEHPFKSFFVNCRLIRYVHIPKDLPATQLAEKPMGNLAVKKTTQTDSFKTVRARRYQKEIAENVRGMLEAKKERMKAKEQLLKK